MATETPGTKEKLHLVVVTHGAKILDVECDEVSLPGRLGYFGVLPGHTPFVSLLKVGELMYRVGKKERYLALSDGFANVSDDKVTVLSEFAERPEDIDLEAAQKDAAEAEDALRAATDRDFRFALAKLERAVTRIQVAGR